jgi:hypothetical protein
MIEQTAILCGMVKTPNPEPATGEIAAYAEYHPHFSRAQGVYRRDEAREKTIQKVEDAHSAFGLRRSSSRSDRSRSLLFAHHRLRGCLSFRDEGGTGGF